MDKKVRVIVSIVAIIALVAVFYFITATITRLTGLSITGKVISEEKKESFAKCLTNKGVIMYGQETCPHCINQKDLFGNSFRFINYVECTKFPDECLSLRGVPAWEINGELYYGTQSLKELSKLSGCEL